jgi:hypothetical protein
MSWILGSYSIPESEGPTREIKVGSGMGNKYLECKLKRGLSAKTPVEET